MTSLAKKIIIILSLVVIFFLYINSQIQSLSEHELLDFTNSQIKVKTKFESNMHLLPSPHLTINNLMLEHPLYGQATIKSLTVHLNLWSLLFGKIKPSSIYFDDSKFIIKAVNKRAFYNFAKKLLLRSDNMHVSILNSHVSWSAMQIKLDELNLNIPRVSPKGVMTISASSNLFYHNLPKTPISVSSLLSLDPDLSAKNTRITMNISLDENKTIPIKGRFNFLWDKQGFTINDGIVDLANIHVKLNFKQLNQQNSYQISIPTFNLHETFEKFATKLPFASTGLHHISLETNLKDKFIAYVDASKIYLNNDIFYVDNIDAKLYKVIANSNISRTNPWLLWLLTQFNQQSLTFKVQSPVIIDKMNLTDVVFKIDLNNNSLAVNWLANLNSSNINYKLNYNYLTDKSSATLLLKNSQVNYWLNYFLDKNLFLYGIGDINLTIKKNCLINCKSLVHGSLLQSIAYWEPVKISFKNKDLNQIYNDKINKYILHDLKLNFDFNNDLAFDYAAKFQNNLIKGYGRLMGDKVQAMQSFFVAKYLHNTKVKQVDIAGNINNIIVSLNNPQDALVRFSRSLLGVYKSHLE